MPAAEEAKPQETTKQKRGLLELEHAPALLPAAPLLSKSYATPIIHAGPVVTKVFESPPVPFVKSYEPLITGPLITKGIGPHIYGAKTILPAPILKAAPIYSAPIIKAAPIYTAPYYSKPVYTAPLFAKPILTHAPIISYAPKLAAPIAYGSYGHGW